MRVLVTGVSGFIGPHLVEACLKKGWDVLGVDIRDFNYAAIECDFHTPRFVFEKRDVRTLTPEDLKDITYIFHLAFDTNIPNSIKHPLETTRDNIDMTVHLLDAATKAGVKKFLFPSTASLYGKNKTPWREDMPPYPIEPYAWQKGSCEYALSMWTECYGLPTATLRLFQVFGENFRYDGVIAIFTKLKKEGRPATLTETSPGSPHRSGQRDFIYVKEVADAFIQVALSPKTGKGDVYNIGTGRVTTIEEIANAMGLPFEFVPKRGFEVERHEADITKTKSVIDWNPKVEVLPWLTAFVKTL
ncbi:MAG: NAD-dependent epimerase/dehydratase family protein [Parcubacteria group bacterium]|nr:NAD-dependent epimerase/dehydratase family protein [Parcubacteria group bacterium]